MCTVFTTVGFGDISGGNAEEQLLCIVLMLVGVMVFGVLLSEVEVGIDELKKCVCLPRDWCCSRSQRQWSCRLGVRVAKRVSGTREGVC